MRLREFPRASITPVRLCVALTLVAGSVYAEDSIARSDADSAGITRGRLDWLDAAPPTPPRGSRNAGEAAFTLVTRRTALVPMRTADPAAAAHTGLIFSQPDSGPPLSLDLYQPALSSRPAPGIVLIHGGGWTGGRREDYSYYASKLAGLGYVAVTIDYRMAPQHRFPAAVQDVKTAVRWLRLHASEYSVDPGRIGVFGGSAGGHLALLAAYVKDQPEWDSHEHSTVTSDVDCVVALYPPTNLAQLRAARNSEEQAALVTRFLGGPARDIPETYRLASPLQHVAAGVPPTLLLHGTMDSIVPVSQSDQLAAALERTKTPYIYDRLPGWPHAMDVSRSVNDRCLFFCEQFFRRAFAEDEQSPREESQ